MIPVSEWLNVYEILPKDRSPLEYASATKESSPRTKELFLRTKKWKQMLLFLDDVWKVLPNYGSLTRWSHSVWQNFVNWKTAPKYLLPKVQFSFAHTIEQVFSNITHRLLLPDLWCFGDKKVVTHQQISNLPLYVRHWGKHAQYALIFIER